MLREAATRCNCCVQCWWRRTHFYSCSIACNIARNNFRGGHMVQFPCCMQCCIICPHLYWAKASASAFTRSYSFALLSSFMSHSFLLISILFSVSILAYLHSTRLFATLASAFILKEDALDFLNALVAFDLPLTERKSSVSNSKIMSLPQLQGLLENKVRLLQTNNDFALRQQSDIFRLSLASILSLELETCSQMPEDISVGYIILFHVATSLMGAVQHLLILKVPSETPWNYEKIQYKQL